MNHPNIVPLSDTTHRPPYESLWLSLTTTDSETAVGITLECNYVHRYIKRQSIVQSVSGAVVTMLQLQVIAFTIIGLSQVALGQFDVTRPCLESGMQRAKVPLSLASMHVQL